MNDLIHSSFTATVTKLKYITITYVINPPLFKALHPRYLHNTTNKKYRRIKRKYSQSCGLRPQNLPYIAIQKIHNLHNADG